MKNITNEKKILYFFDQKYQLTYPYAFIKNVQATGVAFSPQREHEIS
jgi:hypothetical protein